MPGQEAKSEAVWSCAKAKPKGNHLGSQASKAQPVSEQALFPKASRLPNGSRRHSQRSRMINLLKAAQRPRCTERLPVRFYGRYPRGKPPSQVHALVRWMFNIIVGPAHVRQDRAFRRVRWIHSRRSVGGKVRLRHGSESPIHLDET